MARPVFGPIFQVIVRSVRHFRPLYEETDHIIGLNEGATGAWYTWPTTSLMEGWPNDILSCDVLKCRYRTFIGSLSALSTYPQSLNILRKG